MYTALELEKLQQKFRIMEGDRHAYTVESQEQIRRQLLVYCVNIWRLAVVYVLCLQQRQLVLYACKRRSVSHQTVVILKMLKILDFFRFQSH